MSQGLVPIAELWRVAAWAPDLVREAVLARAEREAPDAVTHAQLAELLARVFAVTASWRLAEGAFAAAAAAWADAGEPFRAELLEAIAQALPVAPLSSDDEALAAELELVERALADDPPPLVRRAVLEIRRALPPHRLPARLEAAFGLSPEQHALLFAAVASVQAPHLGAPRSIEAWAALLAPSLRAELVDPAALVRRGLVRATPAMVPHPALSSRLAGRTQLEQPAGTHLSTLPAEPSRTHHGELALALALGVPAQIVGGSVEGRRRAAAAIARRRGGPAILAQPTPGARASTLVDAAREARLLGGLVVLEHEVWRAAGIELDAPAHATLVRDLAPLMLAATSPRGARDWLTMGPG